MSFSAFGQDCDQTVYDGANLFHNQQQIQQAASALMNKGAVPKIWSLPANADLDAAELAIENKCPTWKLNGVRKNTLVVLMVSPKGNGFKAHASIYYGANWHKALDDHWSRITSDYMVQHFKAGDIDGGMISASNQLAARITASQDEALHPVQNSTVNQSTDFSGLWNVLYFIFIAACLFILGWIAISFIRRKKAQKESVSGAQRTAIDYRDRVVDFLEVLKTNGNGKYDSFSQEYSRIASNLKNDPDQDGLSATEYGAIGSVYKNLVLRMNAVTSASDPQPTKPQAPKAEPKVRQSQYSAHQTAPTPPTPPIVPEPPKVVTKERVVYRDNYRDSSNDLVTGVVLGEMLNNNRDADRRAEEDRRASERREEENRAQKAKDDDDTLSQSGGGGSMDWGGGSDSGGGGGFDFGGGGSDSGGGGSTDW